MSDIDIDMLKAMVEHGVLNTIDGSDPPWMEEVEKYHAWIDRAQAAIRTLRRLGYSDHGGELWKPPLGTREPIQ